MVMHDKYNFLNQRHPVSYLPIVLSILSLGDQTGGLLGMREVVLLVGDDKDVLRSCDVLHVVVFLPGLEPV